MNFTLVGKKTYEPASFHRRKAFSIAYFWIPDVFHAGEIEGSWTAVTNVEVSAGLYLDVLIGLNAGELLDFVLGWTTLDIGLDDRSSVEHGVDRELEGYDH